MLFDGFVAHHDLVLLSQSLELDHQIGGVAYIDDKHAEEHPNEEGEGQVPGQPVQGAQNIGVNQEVVQCPQHGPEEGEQGADQALDVSPLVGVVPQHDLEVFQTEKTGYVLNEGHAYGHGGKENQLVEKGIGDHTVFLKRGKQIQRTQPKAVNGQIRPGTEAGVHPFLVFVYNVPEQQLQYPAQHAAHKKQGCQSQEDAHKYSSIFLRFSLFYHEKSRKSTQFFLFRNFTICSYSVEIPFRFTG